MVLKKPSPAKYAKERFNRKNGRVENNFESILSDSDTETEVQIPEKKKKISFADSLGEANSEFGSCESFGNRNLSNSCQNLATSPLSYNALERRCVTPITEIRRDLNCVCNDVPCLCKNSYFTVREDWSGKPPRFFPNPPHLNSKSQSYTNVSEFYGAGLRRNSHSFENLASKLNEIFNNKLDSPETGSFQFLNQPKPPRIDKSPNRSPTKKNPMNFEKSIFLNKIMKYKDTSKKFGSLNDLNIGEKNKSCVLNQKQISQPLFPLQYQLSPDRPLHQPCYFKPSHGKVPGNQSPLLLVRLVNLFFF